MLHGRERELAELRARLDGARNGRSFALVLAGEAGIGKTALLRQAIEDAKDFRVLRGRGFESEAEIPYAGLLAIVRPLLDLAETLPEQQAAGLRSALALGPPTPQDRFAVPVAVLALLAAGAERRPLLLAVDDVHWLDPATREALFFAARRLEAESVGVIFTVRESDGVPAVDIAGLERMDVGGLDASGARALLSGQVAPSVAEALNRATGGNPLALLELPPVLSDDERRGLRPISTPLPTGERVEELFSRRVAELPERTRRALGVAAALDGGALDQLFAALPVLGLSDEDLSPAESSGVVTVRGARLVFKHPLVRSAAYQAQALVERRAAHAALAAVARDPRERAWHRAQAAPGPDEEVAAALDAAAADAGGRGGTAEAAATFARAAELSPSPGDAARRRLAGAYWAHQAGRVDQALTLLDAVEEDRLSEYDRTEARRLRALLAMRSGQIEDGMRILEAEAARLAPTDPSRAADTLLVATPAYMYTGDNWAMVDFAQRARDLAARGEDPAVAELAEVVSTMALSARGMVPEDRLAMFLSPVIDPSSRQPAEVALGSLHGLLFIERYELMREPLEATVEEARRAGAPMRLVYPLALRAELEHRTGRWPAALADVTEAVRLVEETPVETLVAGHPYAVAAIVEMDVGRFAEARHHAECAESMGRRTGALSVLLWACWALGRLALLEEDPRTAARWLLEVVALRDRTGWGEANVVQSDADLADALVALGDRDEALRQAARMRREGTALRRRFTLAVADRLDGMLAADDADFEGAFASSLAHLTAMPTPFERARTQLALGTRRRRAGRVAGAREALQSALECFDRLGAVPWSALAREQLRLAGAQRTDPVDRGAAPSQALTAQEWRVAQLVAQGLTNREVAGSLFLSPKTIEHHLSAIYKKLGVRSRTQLAKLFAGAGREAA